MMKGIKRLLSIIVTIILTFVLAYNVYNMVCVKVMGQDLATINGYGVLEVVSGSMEPTIHVGDMIIIDTHDKNYQEDDIITFYDKQGSFVTHRIIKIDGEKMVTKGDNNDSEDDETDMDKIVGKYVTKLNWVGRILSAFKSPLTLVMILIVGILICVFVSTDENGNPVMTLEEMEFEEFKKYKKEQERNLEDKPKATKTKKTTSSSSPKKKSVASSTTKKTASKKATTKKKSK